MRAAGTSRTLYHSPAFDRRSQDRGTSMSRMTTRSIRPPWRYGIG
jgi:hypothetical protein